MMDYRIIKSPSKGTIDILTARVSISKEVNLYEFDAVGLVQGKLIDMICASDIAEKAVGVTVADVRGSCPQNMIVLAIFGDTSSVESAIEEIRNQMAERKCQ